MKHLNEYLVESKSQEIEKNLEDCAWGIIDMYNQEEVQGWTEDNIKKFVNGDKDPDFAYIVKDMISELENYGDDGGLLPILKKYESKEWKESIEVAILRAMNDYVKDI